MLNFFDKWLNKEEEIIIKAPEINDAKMTEMEEINAKYSSLKSVYGRPSVSTSSAFAYTLFGDDDSKRRMAMCKNMDSLLKEVKKEITKQPLLGRVIRNISKGVLKTGFTFQSPDRTDIKKEKLVKEHFEKILQNSSYNELEFIQEILSNMIKYSNAFVKPLRDEKTKKLKGALVVQNQGWEVHESIGTCHAKTFMFDPNTLYGTDRKGTKYENEYDIWHFVFNRESDEIFGLPIWCSVIPTIKKYNYLISSSIDSYSDQSLERTIYEIGVTKNGSSKPVTPESFRFISDQIASGEDDIIADIPINVNTINKDYTSPDKLLDVLSLQVISGLYTSESQLGKSGAGRQDAEAQENNTNAIIEDFQTSLENCLNKTIVKEICKDLFGNNIGVNNIKIKFTESFNLKERKEKHAIFKFQSGVTDLDEARKECNHILPLSKEKTFFKLYQQTEMNGSVSSKNSPSNQHTGGTGTTKKTTKN